MRRRQVLAGGAALLTAALAGCGHPPVVLDMEAATDADIAEEASQSLRPSEDEYEIAAEAVRNNSSTALGRNPTLDTDEPISFEGEYYNVSVTELGEVEQERYTAEIEIDYNPGDVTPDSGEIDYEALPAVDRDALDELIPPREDQQTDDGYDFGVRYTYPTNASEDSVLVPDQQYDVITHEGERYQISVESDSVVDTEYRYEVSSLAESTTAFADWVRSRYKFTLTGLSEEEQAVVEEAIDDTYFEESDAFRSVIEQFRSHRGIEETDSYGTWLVAYEGEEYITYAEF